jgi:hypothetical protein
MKKLIATTALVSIAAMSAAHAETKISGNLGLSFLAHSYDPSSGSDRTNSFNAVGRESQINISNSGDLSNGMKYAAGFSWEAEGSDTLAGAQTGENTYIDFIAGNTTISISGDHVANINVNPTNLVGFGYLQAAGGKYTTSSGYIGGNYSVSLVQKIQGTNVTLSYIPHVNSNKSTTDIFDGVSNSTADAQGASGTSVVINGDLGIPGVSALIGRDTTSRDGTTKKIEKTKLSAAYTAGKVKIAVEDDEYDTGTASTSVDSKSIGIAYAVSDAVSVGLTYGEAETKSSSVTEETTMVAVGYNLGAVSVQAQYKTVDNLGASQGVEGQEFGITFQTKF